MERETESQIRETCWEREKTSVQTSPIPACDDSPTLKHFLVSAERHRISCEWPMKGEQPKGVCPQTMRSVSRNCVATKVAHGIGQAISGFLDLTFVTKYLFSWWYLSNWSHKLFVHRAQEDAC